MINRSLVHQTIEDVHKAFLRGAEFDEDRIDGWFNLNYASLSLAMKAYLDPNRKDAALTQVKRYVARNRAAFSNKGVVKCERLCDGCDMRFYCNYK